MVGNRNELIKWLLEADNDQTYRVEVFHETRSGKANRYFHRLVGLLARGQRAKFSVIKNELIRNYGNREIVRDKKTGKPVVEFLPDDDKWMESEDKHYCKTGYTADFHGITLRAFCLYKGTSTYSALDMAHLIDCTREECLGCDIPYSEVETFEELQIFSELKKRAQKEQSNRNTKTG